MARFRVHRLDGAAPVVNVQADALDWIKTRMVVPLVATDDAPPPARYLNPVFELDGRAHVMLTQAMAAVPVAALGEPLADLSRHRDEIIRAIDMLFQGF